MGVLDDYETSVKLSKVRYLINVGARTSCSHV
jgi:hypothetical protein